MCIGTVDFAVSTIFLLDVGTVLMVLHFCFSFYYTIYNI
jgi:hypothetical protein